MRKVSLDSISEAFGAFRQGQLPSKIYLSHVACDCGKGEGEVITTNRHESPNYGGSNRLVANTRMDKMIVKIRT